MSEPSEDFAAMFEASLKTSRAKRLVTGETVEGTIVALGPEVAFVDVGGKAEATIENGVLVLRLPKAEEAKPKMITVKARK